MTTYELLVDTVESIKSQLSKVENGIVGEDILIEVINLAHTLSTLSHEALDEFE